jgi:U3 small nucleolar ribonucleoprotein protein LCP5
VCKMSSENGGSKQAVASLQETSQKIKGALLPSIEAHVNNNDFSRKDGLDFLDVKNSLLLSYLIDMTVYLRDKNSGKSNEKTLHRLTEMKTVLDKMRGLDKKLRYQIDKLLAANTSATTFAAGGDNAPEDPLQFRPDLRALKGDSGDSSGSDEEGGQASDADDDLAAARATMAMAKGRKRRDEEEPDGVYRAPRLTAVPYTHDQEGKEKEKEKRAKRRMRATELAQTLRTQYGDAPEQEDIHGGSDYGKQRAAARRLADKEAEKVRYEEDAMIRLTTSRKDKKEKNRQMRQEGSNLAAISDLGNLVRETQAFGRDDDSGDEAIPEPPRHTPEHPPANQRYDNGKRRRGEPENTGGRPVKKGNIGKAKNSFQAALYNTEGGKQKKKKGRR